MMSTALGVAIIYLAGFRFMVACGMVQMPAWTRVPGKVVRAGVCWIRVSVDGWGYSGARRPRKTTHRGRHRYRRFEGTYSARTKGARAIGRRRQTGV